MEPAREGLCMAGVALAEAPATALSNALDASCLTARCRGAAQTLYGELCGRDDHRQTLNEFKSIYHQVLREFV